MSNWKFRPYVPGEMKTNPIQDEFFTTNEVGTAANAIIREGIQNAMDEWTKEQGTRVVVKIGLSGEKYKLEKAEFDAFLNDLYPHLGEPTAGLRNIPDFSKGMKFLTFEDFNTNGLEGDPEEEDDIDADKAHNFFYFWRNIGISRKTGGKLGRWGLGKTVFPAASRINTFWGLTIRRNDPQKMLLLGQSILMSHKIGNEPRLGFVPYGYFGQFRNPESCFCSPLDNEAYILEFAKKFRLKREKNSGLSLIVPFVSDDITVERLVYSSIEQFFLPILQGKLEIHFADEDRDTVINSDSIQTIVDSIDFNALGEDKVKIKDKESFMKLFSLAEWVTSPDENRFLKLSTPALNGVPQWRASLFSDLNMKEMSDKFENGERVSILVPLKFHPVNDNPQIKWYKAVLEKDTSLNKPENYFIRNGITITGIKSLLVPGVRGVVLVEDDSLVKMIGDAENPAHTEIQKDSRNFKNKYNDGDKCLSFFSRTLQELYLKFQKPAEGIEKDLLKNLFYVPVLNEDEDDAKDYVGEGEDKADDKVPPIPPKGNSKVRIQKIQGGFKLIKSKSDLNLIDVKVDVDMGYVVSRGNPIKKYDKLDFEIDKDPITVKAEGVNINHNGLNQISITIIDNNFYFEVTGFDLNRDLIVKTHETII